MIIALNRLVRALLSSTPTGVWGHTLPQTLWPVGSTGRCRAPMSPAVTTASQQPLVMGPGEAGCSCPCAWARHCQDSDPEAPGSRVVLSSGAGP